MVIQRKGVVPLIGKLNTEDEICSVLISIPTKSPYHLADAFKSLHGQIHRSFDFGSGNNLIHC